jgi:pimeloyl-ACP methyl ester carboxylesterase
MRKHTLLLGMKARLLAVLAALFIMVSTVSAAEPPGIPDGWTDGFTYANGIRIHYYHAGAGANKPVMVMVHGVTDIGLCWTTLTWKLQNAYDIYMLDTRGHGLSDPFTPTDNTETLIKDVVGFVQAMNLTKPILVGHSMGAATVMRVGAEYPDLAKAVIMLDPFLASTGSNRGSNRSTQQAAESSTAAPARRASTPLSVSMMGDPATLVKQNNYRFRDLVEKGARENPKWDKVDVLYWALSKKQYHGPYTQAGQQAMFGSMQVGDALSRIPVPALVLKADGSPEARKANEEAVKDLPRVRLVHVDGAAHNLHHDDLARTVKEINDFLVQKVPGSPDINQLASHNQTVEDGIVITRDIPYRQGNSKSWVLDMAMPEKPATANRPALVIVHGGGWASGSKSVDVYQKMMKDYAKKGYVTINVEYRLTGEAPFPACIEDVKCAVRWLRAHANDYKVDPNRVGAYGHSAGAHLALMLGMVPASAGLEGDGGWLDQSSVVNVVAAGSPPTELGRDVPMAKKEWWPIGYIGGNHPPLFLIQGGADPVVRPALTEDFVKKMKAAGATVEYLFLEGIGHGAAYADRLEITDPAIEAFFSKYLKP